MKLPDAQHALVEQGKIVEYLLNAAHPDNGGKAAFFERLGFTAGQWDVLAHALGRLAIASEVELKVVSPFGVKYVVDGALQSPSGSLARVRTVWIVERPGTRPRLVTAYPAD